MSKKKRANYICNQLGIKLKSYDPNPYRDGLVGYKQMKDCTTRSICRLTNESYDTIYKMQVDIMNKKHLDGIGYNDTIIDIMEKYGYCGYMYTDEDESLAEFMHSYKKGRFGILVDEHMMPYINGIWYDADSVLEKADWYLPFKVDGVYLNKETEKYFFKEE